MAKVKPKVKIRQYTGKPKGQAFNDQLLFYGGLIAVTGLAVGGYFWVSSIQATQQAQQQINAAQQTGQQPQAIANANNYSPGIVPAVLPGTAAVTVGAVNPLGAFNTIFPFFGGAQFFTLTRRSCDPFIGGVPTQADLASQGIIITSYQVNNIGSPYPPAVCGIPIMSITVGITDPASAAKIQSLGFLPGTFGGGFLGGLWPKPIGPPPVFPPTPLPHTFPQPVPLPAPVPVPPVVAPAPFPFLPWLKLPPAWTLPARLHPHRRDGHKRDHDDHPDRIHFIGFQKHNFIRPIGHVINFSTH
jgi:hypothetical protein